MAYFEALPESLRPLWIPFAAALSLFVAGMVHLSMAGEVTIAPRAEDLFVYRVRLDTVQHTTQQAAPIGPQSRILVAVRNATSDDWPGVTFRFSGAASAVSIIPPVTFDLYLTRDLEEAFGWREEMSNYFPTMIVQGVADDTGILVDPAYLHQSTTAEKQRLEMIGYGALALCLLPGFVVFRQGRALWRQHMG